ncbi:MAG: phosphoenolpyruvate carboxylase [Lewinellaceae bacterium]|nr:phosphoenolpyruvate carboxylase [Lewinellaceae bacterium]
MKTYSPLALLYHTYNSLFLSLPFSGIEKTGTTLALFSQLCSEGLAAGKNPADIVRDFWSEHCDGKSIEEKTALLFGFIQYVERQVVLFDSVEDALFEQTHDEKGPGSLPNLLNRLEEGAAKDELCVVLAEYSVHLVLTAHPTQFYPGKVLAIINDLGAEIKSNRLETIRQLLMQLGKTGFVNRQKPTPLDEATSLGWYLENIFYHALPDTVYRLLGNLQTEVIDFNNPQLLSLGFWPGGDRDGNPFVLSDTTAMVARRLRESILRCYYRDIRLLRRRLTFRGVEDIILQAETRVYNTLYNPDQATYQSCQELLADLRQARSILIENHDGLFLDVLDRFYLKVKIFGFFFAGLDIRQDSRKIREALDGVLTQWETQGVDLPDGLQSAVEAERIAALLSLQTKMNPADFENPFVQETIASLQQISVIQRENGERGCHRYIISNCQNAGNVIDVLVMARLAGAPPSLDIIPLFETIDDLAVADQVMETLYTNSAYSKHLSARGQHQTIMLGFSDGTKDGGYLRANWSIYQAKVALSEISRKYGIKVTFFDGRGGPPGRGGGNNASFYAAQGKDIQNHGIQVTIQGQTISSTYGTQESARYNVERLLAAGLEGRLFPDRAGVLSAEDRQLMDDLADTAYKAYLGLKNHASFVPYLENMTPLKWYGQTNIGSRPAKRGGSDRLRFEDLRAIPFVGAWAQMKQNVPGYYGFGTAILKFEQSGKSQQLHGLYQRSLFLRTLVENSMQSLSKSNFAVTRYLENNPEFGGFWKMLFREFEDSSAALLRLSNEKELLSENTASRESIFLREQIVLPLIVIQQFAMQQLQRTDKMPAAEAAAYHNMVLRAMFGIINAARNAA